MTTDEVVIERLDRLIALLSLAFREPIDAERERILADPVAATILDSAADDWVLSGDLRNAVVTSANVAARTVNRRVAELVNMGALTARGAAQTRAYRSTGLI